jgi:hypothetical protein
MSMVFSSSASTSLWRGDQCVSFRYIGREHCDVAGVLLGNATISEDESLVTFSGFDRCIAYRFIPCRDGCGRHGIRSTTTAARNKSASARTQRSWTPLIITYTIADKWRKWEMISTAKRNPGWITWSPFGTRGPSTKPPKRPKPSGIECRTTFAIRYKIIIIVRLSLLKRVPIFGGCQPPKICKCTKF